MKDKKNDIKGHHHSLSKINEATKDFNIEKEGRKNNIKEQAEQKETSRRLKIQNKKLLEQLSTYKKRIRQINAEKSKEMIYMNQVKELQYQLSQALGSCYACWGIDPGCPHCAGNGISGWRKINKRLFNTYVLPALEKLYGLSKKIK